MISQIEKAGRPSASLSEDHLLRVLVLVQNLLRQLLAVPLRDDPDERDVPRIAAHPALEFLGRLFHGLHRFHCLWAARGRNSFRGLHRFHCLRAARGRSSFRGLHRLHRHGQNSARKRKPEDGSCHQPERISLKLQADGFMSANGYGCVLTLPLLLLTLVLLLLLLLLQDDDGWSRLFRFSPETVRRRLWPKWATSAAQGLRPKNAVSISISLRVVARTFLRRHSRQMRSHILMSGNVREAGSKAGRHFQRIFSP